MRQAIGRCQVAAGETGAAFQLEARASRHSHATSGQRLSPWGGRGLEAARGAQQRFLDEAFVVYRPIWGQMVAHDADERHELALVELLTRDVGKLEDVLAGGVLAGWRLEGQTKRAGRVER